MEKLQRQVFELPLTDIFVDYDWNCRSRTRVFANDADAVQDEGIAQGEGLEGLKRTIQERGQDQPVTVRPVVKGQSLRGLSTGCPFELVAGFRRYTAILQLRLPTILCEVRELSPLDALLLNGRENTDRQNLCIQDFVKLVHKLVQAGLTYIQIGHELSVTPSYVGRMARITKLPPAVLLHWQGEAKLPGRENVVDRALTAKDLLALHAAAEKDSLTPEQVTERYKEMLATKPPTDYTGNSPLHAAQRVQKAAALAGQLVRTGILQPGSLDWSKIIGPRASGFILDSGSVRNLDDLYKMAETAYKEQAK